MMRCHMQQATASNDPRNEHPCHRLASPSHLSLTCICMSQSHIVSCLSKLYRESGKSQPASLSQSINLQQVRLYTSSLGSRVVCILYLSVFPIQRPTLLLAGSYSSTSTTMRRVQSAGNALPNRLPHFFSGYRPQNGVE